MGLLAGPRSPRRSDQASGIGASGAWLCQALCEIVMLEARMIIPISHEDHESRRWPVITGAILALCFCVHLAFVLTGGVDRGSDAVASRAGSALEYLADHPYL